MAVVFSLSSDGFGLVAGFDETPLLRLLGHHEARGNDRPDPRGEVKLRRLAPLAELCRRGATPDAQEDRARGEKTARVAGPPAERIRNWPESG